jgi:hypothetical protein
MDCSRWTNEFRPSVTHFGGATGAGTIPADTTVKPSMQETQCAMNHSSSG